MEFGIGIKHPFIPYTSIPFSQGTVCYLMLFSNDGSISCQTSIRLNQLKQ